MRALWYLGGNSDVLTTYQSLRDYPYDIYELIDEHRPKLICEHAIDDMSHPSIANHYRQVEDGTASPIFWIRTD